MMPLLMSSAGIRAREVLVVDPRLAGQAHTIESSGRDHHQGGDVAILFVEQRVHLERPVEVVLTVENGHADVAALGQQDLEVLRCLDVDGVISGLGKLRADCGELGWR
jgi:citrate lyase synthetase